MSRLTATVILIVAGALIYSLVFTPYHHVTERWESTDTGGLVRVSVECPPPWRVLLLGDEANSERDRGSCVFSSRTLAFEAGAVLLIGLALAWKPITRPRPAPLQPLSKTLNGEED